MKGIDTKLKGKKILILDYNNGYGILRNDKNVTFANYYKIYKNKMLNYFRKFIKKFLPFFLKFFFDDWKENINKYDIIIMFDSGYNSNIPKYIKKKNIKCKTIFWYWNKVNKINVKNLGSKYIDYYYSYDKNDCKKYNMRYNTQCYNKKLAKYINKQDEQYDFVFLGTNKGRKEEIISLENVLNKYNYKTNFKIIENKKEFIPYQDYLKMVTNSKCIVDFVKEGTCGLTLRIFEGMFFQKKIITNNKNIVEYDFYNSNNIFIIGIDEIN